jgi:hypothetical protein
MKIKKVGDVVWMDSYTSMGQSSLAGDNKRIIKEVDYRFDEKTGEKFSIYKVGDEWYDGRCGSCYSNKSFMYYIEEYSESNYKERTYDDFKNGIDKLYESSEKEIGDFYKNDDDDLDFE